MMRFANQISMPLTLTALLLLLPQAVMGQEVAENTPSREQIVEKTMKPYAGPSVRAWIRRHSTAR